MDTSIAIIISVMYYLTLTLFYEKKKTRNMYVAGTLIIIESLCILWYDANNILVWVGVLIGFIVLLSAKRWDT